MPSYRIVNDTDPNESFVVEARSHEEAAFQALGYLGWAVDMNIPEEEDELEFDEYFPDELDPELHELDELYDVDRMMDMPPESYE